MSRILKEFNVEVSEWGNIVSMKTGKELKQQVCRIGYHRVCVTVGDKRKVLSVHRAVALVYVPNPENKKEVNHIDGDKSNNRKSNLEWCTREENMAHAKRVLGVSGKPEMFDDCQALTIHTLKGHTKQIDLAAHYKCTQTTISEVQRGKNYGDIYKALQ